MSQERTDNLFASESWTAVYTAYSNISLKAYDFDTIRTALLDYTAQTYPEKFNDFVASSEFIAILDLVAYLGHSLSFRLDMNTRENFMDTAERRASVLQMAKSLGYNKTRPINAKGFMKISSVSTTEAVKDNEGVSLAGKTINWNDSNNADWYENFISILNSSFAGNTKIQNPSSELTIADVEHALYEINEDTLSKNINYSFGANISGANRNFEAVRVVADKLTSTIYEDEPNANKNFTIINRNDNLGSSSDRTGFFVYASAGTLQLQDNNYSTVISNRIAKVEDIDISHTDVWVQKINSQKQYVSSVTKVDNNTRETAIYNALRSGSGDIVSVTTLDNNSIQLTYPDGIFGNAASGGYRTWYRKVDNDDFSVNASDITNSIITIPYVATDNRVYRLTFTLTSTRDFTENYSGETYASVRRIAPRSYYSQDRMVNAQDYNVYPLTLGTNVVRKLKSVNTSFAGNSRFFEMDDVLGHHSNLSVTGSDGTLFVEDETIKMPLRYNKTQGNSDNFIRNELTKAIKHPSLLNYFFYQNKDNVAVNVAIALSYSVSTSDTMVINTNIPSSTATIYEGDMFELQVGTNMTWAKVITCSAALSDGSKNYTLNKAIPDNGTVVRAVRGLRTRFTDAEITDIKTKIDSATESTFTIKYSLITSTASQWQWQVHEGATPSDAHVVFNYASGIRDNESEYVAEIIGKKVAFESRDQVKFFYGNISNVVDNETKLATRDKILLNYKTSSSDTNFNASQDSPSVTIGQGKVKNAVAYNTVGAEFDADFLHTGARETYTFVDTQDAISGVTYEHFLISEDGLDYKLDSSDIVAPTSASGNKIGDATDLGDGIDKLKIQIDNLATVVSLGVLVGANNTTTATSEENLSNANLVINYDGTEDDSNAESSFTTISTNDLTTKGFKGDTSQSTLLTYFATATSTSNFVFRDVGDGIEQNEIVTTYDSNTDTYKFVLPFQHADTDASTAGNQNVLNITPADADIKFKQKAYGEFTIASSTPLTSSNVVLRTDSGTYIDTDHVTITNTSGLNYKIVFWTYPVSVNDLIDVNIGTGATLSDLTNSSVRVKASFALARVGVTTTSVYQSVASYVYDDYLTNAGYKDSTKVKLNAGSVDDHPFALLDVTSGSTVVMENYTKDNIEYQRTSKYAVAAAQISAGIPDNSMPSTATLLFNTTTSTWYKRIAGSWNTNFAKVPGTNNVITHGTVTYTPTEGVTFVEDEFTSFRWDHYADLDKRIDPSTSNIIDMYVLGSDYVRNVEKWSANGFKTATPIAPNNYELSKLMKTIEPKAAIGDHIAYIPVEFKYLFGSYAKNENQATFKVIKKLGVGYTDSEIKTAVSNKVNEYFSIDNWDFGATFYFSELAAYLHKELADYISSVVITPKYSTNEFTKLLSISSSLNEIFMAVTTSNDVKIIKQLSQSELVGE